MTAALALVSANTITNCDGCSVTSDECFASRDDCCHACTHYPPLEQLGPDVDEVAIERAMAGDQTVPLNRAEYAEVVARLHAKGYSQSRIADLVGTTARSVDRWTNNHHRPISRAGRGRNVTTADTTIEALLETARTSNSRKLLTAAQRASDAIKRVRELLTEEAAKVEARQRIDDLERELREAKAALRGTPPVRNPLDPPQSATRRPCVRGRVTRASASRRTGPSRPQSSSNGAPLAAPMASRMPAASLSLRARVWFTCLTLIRPWWLPVDTS